MCTCEWKCIVDHNVEEHVLSNVLYVLGDGGAYTFSNIVKHNFGNCEVQTQLLQKGVVVATKKLVGNAHKSIGIVTNDMVKELNVTRVNCMSLFVVHVEVENVCNGAHCLMQVVVGCL